MIVCQHCYRMSPWNFGLTSVICCFECGKRVKVCRKQIAFQWNGWYGFCAPFLFSSIHLSYIFVWSAVFDSMIMVQSTDSLKQTLHHNFRLVHSEVTFDWCLMFEFQVRLHQTSTTICNIIVANRMEVWNAKRYKNTVADVLFSVLIASFMRLVFEWWSNKINTIWWFHFNNLESLLWWTAMPKWPKRYVTKSRMAV